MRGCLRGCLLGRCASTLNGYNFSIIQLIIPSNHYNHHVLTCVEGKTIVTVVGLPSVDWDGKITDRLGVNELAK